MATAKAQLQCTPCNTRFHTDNNAASSPLGSNSHWHFPGPSSRFNQRDRASTHSRVNTSHAVRPTLETERRAHRRAHSSYHLPTTVATHEQFDRVATRKSLNAQSRFTSLHTPLSSASARSPPSRFPSFTSTTAAMAGANGVVTPAKSPNEFRTEFTFHDSPLSDYFTDDNRSIDEVAAQTPPALETQQLLVRLSKLQSALVRSGNDSQALYLVGRRMSEIENEMDSLHSQSRQPPELDDSGLFMDEADEDEKEIAKQEIQQHTCGVDGAMDERPARLVDTRSEAESGQEKALLTGKAHDLLASVSFAHQELQRRFHEIRNLRESHAKSLHEKEIELRALRTENEHMQQDLNLDHGDFVLLDGQLRLIQDRVSRVDEATDGTLSLAVDALRADCRKAIEKVNSKRIRHSKSRTRPSDQFDEALKLGRWKMDVVRHPSGRVDSMTLERMSIQEEDTACHYDMSETCAKVIDRHPRLLYTDQGSQVDSSLSSSVSDDQGAESYESLDDEYDYRKELRQTAVEDDLYSSDCAITTSPPSELGDSTTDNDNTTGSGQAGSRTASTGAAIAPHKTAWHELWDSLAELAGVGEHRW